MLSDDTGTKRLLAHLLFWVVIDMIFTFSSYPLSFREASRFIRVISFAYLPYAYFLSYYLVPRYLFRGKYWHFFLFLVPAMLATVTLDFAVRRDGHAFFVFVNFMSMNMIASAFVVTRLYIFYMGAHRKKLQLQSARMAAELKILQSQLHPHFLFNTLNNLHSLIVQRQAQAPEMVRQLSVLFRYILVECNQDAIPLQTEIDILKSYIELQRIRYDQRLSIDFRVSGEAAGNYILPLILLPLLENSFKHGVSQQTGECHIDLEMRIDAERFQVKLSNTTDGEAVRAAATTPALQRSGGIGLHNIRKRMSLFYKSDYLLSVIPAMHRFTVWISIDKKHLRKHAPAL